MAEGDIITMSREELKRIGIVRKVLENSLSQVGAGECLGLSSRQVNRIVMRVRAEGEKGVVHRLRGRPGNKNYPKKFRDKVLKLYDDKYEGFGPLLASEKMLELDKIRISDETLRNWLIAVGKWTKRRKGRKHRQWRERRERYGAMVQMDGSHHDWLEGRGPKLVLMGYIDDATGKVYGRFYAYEGTIPAMDSFKIYIKKYGIPIAVYLDKHSTYKSWAKPTIEQELSGEETLSQFERALCELGVEVIHADSPQAKGRVERLFKTFQDRLVKEMRLKGIKGLEEANEFLDGYLPEFNARFNVVARERGDLHRKIAKGTNLERVFCVKEDRVLRNDFTISYDGKWYQILDRTHAQKVILEKRLDGTMRIYDKDNKLRYKEIRYRPMRAWQKKETGSATAPSKWVPAADHPWRNLKFGAATQKPQSLEP
jgi:hypothetical protein